MLADAGADVAITYRARRREAGQVRGAIESRGSIGLALEADLAVPEECDRVVDEAARGLGGLDVFVANAGIWPAEEVALGRMDGAQWRRTMAVNLDAVFYGCRAAVRAMGRGDPARPSRIVIVASTAAQRGEAFHADYAASKGALISLVKSLAVEAAPGMTVNGVAPGWVDTEMASVPYQRDGGKGRAEIEAGIPLGRVAKPEEIAGPIVFLCSDMARHITGEILNVNGGSVLCG